GGGQGGGGDRGAVPGLQHGRGVRQRQPDRTGEGSARVAAPQDHPVGGGQLTPGSGSTAGGSWGSSPRASRIAAATSRSARASAAGSCITVSARNASGAWPACLT